MLTTVVFDADETLIDLRPAITGGLVAVLTEMRRLTAAAAEVTLADLQSDGDAAFAAMAAEPVTAIRRAALARSLARPGGLTMDPDKVENQLYRTAAEHACPEPRLVSYVNEGRSTEFDAYCAGGTSFNGFYGHGIVDAYAAVTTPLR